jgi:Cd2+/Zn2+-exporting ATPase
MEKSFQIKGLDCASCAQTVEMGIAQLEGVQRCELNFASATLRVAGDVTPEQVVARVRELGYDVVEPEAETRTISAAPPSFLRFMWERPDTRLALVGALLILPGVILEELLGIQRPLIDAVSLCAWLAAGFPIARSAWRSLRTNHDININVLMTIAGAGAVVIGAYTEAGMVIVLFAIGEALEGYTGDRARHAIRSLMQVAPDEASLLRPHPGSQVQPGRVKVNSLRPGDVILVKPGERIPMDGRVVSGASSVNQAPITGESQPVEKAIGSEVLASSINGEGSLEIEVTRLSGDMVISQLIRLVQAAQEKRAPAERFVDRFARYYTPSVVALATLAAVIPPLLFGQVFLNPADPTRGWLYRGLALLVVACPCALVISTPVSIISAISNAARHGVLVKGGAFVEMLARTKAIAFDKTGTLTQGRPVVVAVRPADHRDAALNGGSNHCAGCEDLLALASAVERHSEHPIAHAVVDEAARFGLDNRYPTAAMVTALPGRGVTGKVGGRQVVIGSHLYFSQQVAHPEEHCAEAERDARRGHTPMMVAADGEYLGTIVVADAARATSREALQALRRMGYSVLVMLTGDNAATGAAVAEQVGVTDVRAGLLPEDKMTAIQALRQEFGPVAMVGDGINDAPALAAADLGIAIGGASGGTAQAMETADITLMSDDLRRLPFAFVLGRTAMRTIQVNLVLSIGIKLAFLALVLLGMGTMWMAVTADMGTSLLVTLNGMRLLSHPRPSVS